MGNSTSKKSNLAVEIDSIASKYILSQNFQDMNKLSVKDECDKAVVLTTRILKKNLNPLEQTEVVNRIDNGFPPPERKEVESAPESKVGGEDAKCLKIAKFYIKIAHVYAAIMKTINPVITIIDSSGKEKKYDLLSYPNMVTEDEIKSISHNNFCTRRLHSLFQDSDMQNGIYKLKPERLCGMDSTITNFYVPPKNMVGGGSDDEDDDDDDERKKKNRKKKEGEDEKKKEEGDEKEEKKEEEEKEVFEPEIKPIAEPSATFENESEIGIPELMKLYYDTGYDPVKGDFTEMSDAMRASYVKDVNVFYKTFTGEAIPLDDKGKPTINRFEEIPLNKFKKSDKCKPAGDFTQTYEGTDSDDLFQQYGEHMKQMLNNMNSNQEVLLNILNQLFKFPKTKENKKDMTEPAPEPAPEPIETEATASGTQGEIQLPNMNREGVLLPTDRIEPMLGVEPPALQQAPPALQQAPPALQQAPPALQQAPPALQQAPPALQQAPSIMQTGGEDAEEKVIIQPNLTAELLDSLINSTRKLIVELYITCEADFLKGILLLESIIATKLAKTTQEQVKELTQMEIDFINKKQF